MSWYDGMSVNRLCDHVCLYYDSKCKLALNHVKVHISSGANHTLTMRFSFGFGLPRCKTKVSHDTCDETLLAPTYKVLQV